MATKVETDVDTDIHENSLDNSADGEYLGMVDEGSFGAEEQSQLTSQPFLDTNENTSTTYSFRDISGSVTYKIVHMTSDEPSNNISQSPNHVIPETEYYVISNPVEVFGTNSPKKAIKKEPLQAKAVTAKKRDDKRRATHNEVERRRRDKINSWITKLAALVPNSGLADTVSKGGILAKACDHITELTERQKRLDKLEVENEKLVLEILRLNQELAEVRKENSSMRNQLADNCIVMAHRPKGQKS
ncbi:upstream stimulatory factor 2 isoform X1 [Plodia interpunctella]|uniref:upstream stimulatory factor 2 isoform X1 n=1 Tax=Plodia interpunctella TaxID=58824 RepID=UPI002367F38E|nr:upstream stimulatory factor 2 isoform X1 [Plodia interpunctella]